MESQHFDNLIRTLASATSRRRLFVTAIGLLHGPFGLEMARARKRRRRHKRKKHNGNNALPPAAEPDCIPNCGGHTCGDNGCGDSCGPCGDGFVCEGRACLCPSDREICNGGCLAACPPFQTRNPGTCGCCGINSIPCSANGACCSNFCPGNLFCVGLNSGAACTFDAQCGSNDCDGGQCAA